MTQLYTFDEELYKQCKKELSKRWVEEIILGYRTRCKITKGYGPEFLSYYYSPILTVLKQILGNLENKYILEIGYRMPIFLDYLEKQGAVVYGIDIEPYVENGRNLLKMSVEDIDKEFLKEHNNQFHAIIERITLSRQYDEEYFLETGEHRFKNKEKILLDLYRLLRPNGILVLQDDRGTIFSEAQFVKIGFRKIMKEIPIIFRDRDGNYLGWNVLVTYQKPAR